MFGNAVLVAQLNEIICFNNCPSIVINTIADLSITFTNNWIINSVPRPDFLPIRKGGSRFSDSKSTKTLLHSPVTHTQSVCKTSVFVRMYTHIYIYTKLSFTLSRYFICVHIYICIYILNLVLLCLAILTNNQGRVGG